MLYSNRTESIKPSATLTIAAHAAKLKAQGQDIISLSTGEPDFDTPEFIKEAAIKAIHDGQTKYTAVDGTPELKAAIQHKFKRDNNLDYDLDQILVSCGAKHSIYNALQALLNSGDEVIVPCPYWVSYPDMVRLCNGEPRLIETNVDANFKMSPEQLENAITKKTKCLILNSPSNPTGVCYTPDELKALADVLLKHPHVFVLTDDIYEHIYWANEPFANIVNVCPQIKDRAIVINGVSKAYAMTGWRIGYTAAPNGLIKIMKKIQGQSTSNPCAIAQAASVTALQAPISALSDMVKAFKKRHDFAYQNLRGIDGFKLPPANGTFYLFPNISEAIKNTKDINNDVEFCERLLLDGLVSLVPGTAFGAPGCIRLSFAVDIPVLETAISRLRAFLSTASYTRLSV